MKKHLFLTGPSGCGKTTMIREALGEKLAYAGGFVTERVCDDTGKLLGYELSPAAAAAGVQGFTPVRFLDYEKNPPKSDNEVFRTIGKQLLEESAYYPFSVIDEFGGCEILIPQFRGALADFLSSDQPCIGVLKGRENAKELQDRFGFGFKYNDLIDNLWKVLKADPDTAIVKVHGHGDILAKKKVRQWVEEYCK